MITVFCEQNSDQWYKLKLGKPSASCASKIITNEGNPSKQRTLYMFKLAAEIATGKREEEYQNPAMIEGNSREDESRKLYEFIHKVKVKQVGLIYRDKNKSFLCSADGIIKNKYGLELKNVIPSTQVKYLLKGALPSEHFAQIQFSLYVTDFKFWDFMSYSPGLKPLLLRIGRDKKFIKALEVELKKFCLELKQIVRRIK